MRKTTDAEKADIAVARAAGRMRRNPIVRALGWASEIADQPPLISLCAATFAAGLILRDRRLASAGGRMLASELVATKLKNLIKHQIDRTRPRVLAEGGRYRAKKGHNHASAMNSFPSGHTAGAAAVARAFAREYPEHGRAAYTGAVAIGAIQIPRSRHYPADVGAGAIVGLVAEEMVHFAEAMLGRALREPSPRKAPVPRPT